MSAFQMYRTVLKETVKKDMVLPGKASGKRKKRIAEKKDKATTLGSATVTKDTGVNNVEDSKIIKPSREDKTEAFPSQGNPLENVETEADRDKTRDILTCSNPQTDDTSRDNVTSQSSSNQNTASPPRDAVTCDASTNERAGSCKRAEVEISSFDCAEPEVCCVGLSVGSADCRENGSFVEGKENTNSSPSKENKQPNTNESQQKDVLKSGKRKKQQAKVVSKKRLKTQRKVLILDQKTERMGKRRDTYDGKEEARHLFEWLVHPVDPDQFFKELWESKPLLIKRHNTKYNAGWFSSEDMSNIIRDHPIQFGTHLDLTTFKDGKRQTHNPPGRATPDLVWKHYREGGSVRMLNPQTYSESVWLLLSTLQDFFRSTMGANVYLTPPGTQGFAPHFDDIEAFMIQLEGKKHWRLYSPRDPHEVLPQRSSPNLTEEDLGKPILDTILEAGDMLYFPRGIIHQGKCLPDSHSLHLTISTYQCNTWGDLLEKLLPKALAVAREEDKEFRHGLPRDYLDYSGVSYSETDNTARTVFMRKIESLMGRLMSYAPVDSAIDDLASRLLHDALPPHPDRGSISQYSSSTCCTNGVTSSPTQITCTSRVRLTSPYCARLMVHEECVSVQHSCSNTRLIHEIKPQEIDYPQDYGPALEILVNSYPQFTEVNRLPLTSKASITLVQELVDQGILVVRPNEISPPIFGGVKMRGTKKSHSGKVRNQSDSTDDIPIKLRSKQDNCNTKSESRIVSRPLSDLTASGVPSGVRPISGIYEPPAREGLDNRKCRTLEPVRREKNSGRNTSLEKRFSYGRRLDTSSITLTEV